MLRKIFRRALFLYLAFVATCAVVVGVVVWYHLRVAAPCPTEGGAEPVVCRHQFEFTGDALPFLAANAIALAISVLAAWTSVKMEKHSGA